MSVLLADCPNTDHHSDHNPNTNPKLYLLLSNTNTSCNRNCNRNPGLDKLRVVFPYPVASSMTPAPALTEPRIKHSRTTHNCNLTLTLTLSTTKPYGDGDTHLSCLGFVVCGGGDTFIEVRVQAGRGLWYVAWIPLALQLVAIQPGPV